MVPNNSSPEDGLFFSVEGPDGSGTSTQLKLIAGWLKGKGETIVKTREPGGTERGEIIRKQLLKVETEHPLSFLSEYLLFSAARKHHVDNVIKPALSRGKVVLTDRFFGSSFVYQGYAGNPEIVETINNLNLLVTDGIKPDLRIVLNLSYEEAKERLKKEGKNKDRIEKKSKEFHQKVSEGYKKLASECPNDVETVQIDASQSKREVFREITKNLTQKFPSLGS